MIFPTLPVCVCVLTQWPKLHFPMEKCPPLQKTNITTQESCADGPAPVKNLRKNLLTFPPRPNCLPWTVPTNASWASQAACYFYL